MPLSKKQRERKRQVMSELDAKMRRALTLYLKYQTMSREYKQIAESMHMTDLDLNVRCNEIYGRRIVLGQY